MAGFLHGFFGGQLPWSFITEQLYYLALLAEAYGIMGQPEAGLTVLTEALALVDKMGMRWYDPELYRLKGKLLFQQSLDHQAEAAACFHKALTIARSQQAKSFKLAPCGRTIRLARRTPWYHHYTQDIPPWA